MSPEFNRKVARKIIKGNSISKFVRRGVKIWVGSVDLYHKDIAKTAGFKVVDDAGIISPLNHNEIVISGNSIGYATQKDSPERERTIKVAQKTAGASIKIIKK